jgi:hypothetical protein
MRAIKSVNMRWAGHITLMEEMRNICKIFVRKSQEKRSLEGLTGYKWKDNIKMDHTEIGCECVDWIQVAQDSFQMVSFYIYSSETSRFHKSREFLDQPRTVQGRLQIVEINHHILVIF